MKVESVMTREVVTVAPQTPLKDVARLLVARGISGVPVCDAAGRVLGVVSEGDILFKEEGAEIGEPGLLRRLLYADEDAIKVLARTAEEAMTSPAVTIAPTRRVDEAARTMVERHVNRLPVVAGDRLVGIVTRADLVAAFVRPDEAIRREIGEDVLLRTLWIDPQPIEVEVRDGDVRLSGRVATASEAELIATYVARVPGVVDVDVSELAWRDDDRGAEATVSLHV